jgi:hypothetical protein
MGFDPTKMDLGFAEVAKQIEESNSILLQILEEIKNMGSSNDNRDLLEEILDVQKQQLKVQEEILKVMKKTVGLLEEIEEELDDLND